MIPFMIKSIFWEIFIYLDFDTVDHSIWLKILEHYETKGRKLSFFFQSYLSSCKQYIQYIQQNKTGNTGLSNIISDVPQGSILGPVFFIVYINNFCQMPEFLKPI